MADEYNILLVTDKSEFIVEFKSLINDSKSLVDVASSEKEVINIFDNKKNKIIVFSYSSIEKSEYLYNSLYSNSKLINITPHRAIIMCDHVDIEKAIERCMRNIFFDYVVISPRFDRYRIKLSIRNAIISINQAEYEFKSREFAKVGNEVGVYGAEIGGIIDKSSNIKSNSEKTFMEMSDDIRKDIKAFSAGLLDIRNKSANVVTKEVIDKEVDRFSENVIDKKIQHSKNKVDREISNYTDQLIATREKHKDVTSILARLSKSIKKKVLVVEDNEVYGDIVKTLIDKSNEYDVNLVSTIHEGIVFVITSRPDIVLLDYELPDGNASVLLEKIRCVPSSKNIPVIILTSHNNTDVYTSTIMLGAQDFLVKPASEDVIMGKIKEWLDPEKK